MNIPPVVGQSSENTYRRAKKAIKTHDYATLKCLSYAALDDNQRTDLVLRAHRIFQKMLNPNKLRNGTGVFSAAGQVCDTLIAGHCFPSSFQSQMDAFKELKDSAENLGFLLPPHNTYLLNICRLPLSKGVATQLLCEYYHTSVVNQDEFKQYISAWLAEFQSSHIDWMTEVDHNNSTHYLWNFAINQCNENVVGLVLQKHPQLVYENGFAECAIWRNNLSVEMLKIYERFGTNMNEVRNVMEKLYPMMKPLCDTQKSLWEYAFVTSVHTKIHTALSDTVPSQKQLKRKI